jgi:hypothetical protein
MKPEFHEAHSGQLDPLDGRVGEFDWDAIESALGEQCPDLTERDYAAMGIALRRVLQWMVTVGRCEPKKMAEIIGRRTLALAWVMDPSILEGSPSLSSLAKRIGTSKAVLSLSSSKASKVFGISNRAQSHAWNRKRGPTTKAKATLPKGKSR